MTASVPTPQTPQQKQLAAAVAADLQEHANLVVQQLADLLATVPDAQLFGDTELLLRDKLLPLVAHALQARLDQKKTATSVAASTAPTVDELPPSTTTANAIP